MLTVIIHIMIIPMVFNDIRGCGSEGAGKGGGGEKSGHHKIHDVNQGSSYVVACFSRSCFLAALFQPNIYNKIYI